MSFSIGVNHLPKDEDELAHCLSQIETGRKMCHGSACTYSLVDDPQHIIHVVPEKEEHEIAAAKVLSDEKLVPPIRTVKTCAGKTFTVTDVAYPATSIVASAVGGFVLIRDRGVDRLARMPHKYQMSIVELCTRLIETGRVHYHCTLTSIGFTEEGARFIDLEGMKTVKFYSGKEKLYALAFCLLQLLERVPDDEIESTVIFKVAMSAISGSHFWGEELEHRHVFLKDVATRFPLKEVHGFSSRSRGMTEANSDIFLAVMYYAAILTTKTRQNDFILSELKRLRC
jgi:hypothetical protein